MFALLGLILPFLTGLLGPAAEIANRITALKEARVKADSDKELAKINSELEQVHDRKAVLLAEAGNRISGAINAVTRAMVMWGFCIPILIKYGFWDKVIGSFYGCATRSPWNVIDRCYTFETDGLDPNMWWIVLAGIAFYFVTTPRKT